MQNQKNTPPESTQDQPATTLEVVTETPSLETMQRGDTLAIWGGYMASVEKLKASVDAVLSSDPAIPANAKIARANRLELRQIRIAVEKARKELGDGHLRKIQSINSEAKKLKELIEPYEAQLLAIEEHSERVEAERIRKLTADRTEALSKFCEISAAVNYGALTDEEFDKMLSDAKTLHELREAEAKRIESERIAKEKAEAEERERIRLENDRLKKEAAEKESALAAERARVESEKKAAEEKARKEREAIEAKAQAQREAAQKKADEEAAKLRQQAEKERKEREAAEAEIAKQKQAEAARIAAEEKKKAEAEAAPDKEKLIAFAKSIRQIPTPQFSTDKYKALSSKIRDAISELASKIEAAGGVSK
jgi:hypothetical protein